MHLVQCQVLSYGVQVGDSIIRISWDSLCCQCYVCGDKHFVTLISSVHHLNTCSYVLMSYAGLHVTVESVTDN